jgi:hypothetical protein
VVSKQHRRFAGAAGGLAVSAHYCRLSWSTC